jgi:hypothetical protein
VSEIPRTFAVVLLLVSLPGLLVAQEKQKGGKKRGKKAIKLFDGKSLEGWGCHLVDPDVKTEDVWSVKDGILICKGEPLGYLFTKKEYKNFRLIVEWRWAPGKEPGNSGVLMRATGEPIGFMPKCIEAQLKSGSAGDIWAFRGFCAEGPRKRLREVQDHESLGDFVGVGKSKDAENKPGEWNTYRIQFKDDSLKLSINGERVNAASGCDVVAGKIGLQSEGAEIHFRKVNLIPLD